MKIRSNIPKKRTEQKATHLLLVEFPMSDWEDIQRIRAWYRSRLSTSVSAASIIRTAVREHVAKETKQLIKADRGRYHAKLRSD